MSSWKAFGSEPIWSPNEIAGHSMVLDHGSWLAEVDSVMDACATVLNQMITIETIQKQICRSCPRSRCDLRAADANIQYITSSKHTNTILSWFTGLMASTLPH